MNNGPLLDSQCKENPGAIVVKHSLRLNSQTSETEERNVAILIDEVGDILTGNDWVRHPVPANVSSKVISLLSGIINRNNETIHLLNLDELLRQCTDNGESKNENPLAIPPL